MHYTLLVTNPEYHDLADSLGRHDVFSMMVLGFQNVAISGVYIVAMFFLSLHINHAAFSLFQTLGLCNDRWEEWWKRLSMLLAVVLFVGYVSIPVAVLAGFVTLPGGGM
jgi:succinate dehydrogenase / fumarate reductase cytochrome b subunit